MLADGDIDALLHGATLEPKTYDVAKQVDRQLHFMQNLSLNSYCDCYVE